MLSVMSNIKFTLNRDGVRQILKSAESQAMCHEQAQEIADRLGDGYVVSDYVGTNRCNSSVVVETREAMQDNLDNNSLLKAMR